MTLRAGVIDYGMGNLHSVAKAIARAGAVVRVSASRRVLAESDLLVLPGVGAFGAAMTALARRRLDDFLRRWVDDDRPYLGICLGYQLLFERSGESRGVPGLGALKGNVTRLRPSDFGKRGGQIPHMGWNRLRPTRAAKEGWFARLPERPYVYFVHTYYPCPVDESLIASTTDYGIRFASSVSRGRLFACQFHPEKSAGVGAVLLRNVVRATGRRPS